MKVYQVTQVLFTEGNSGDLEVGDNQTIGLFSTKEKAEEAANSIEQPIFNAQFGSGKQECTITEIELDVIQEHSKASGSIYGDSIYEGEGIDNYNSYEEEYGEDH